MRDSMLAPGIFRTMVAPIAQVLFVCATLDHLWQGKKSCQIWRSQPPKKIRFGRKGKGYTLLIVL